jgi:beta-N-acetylhexosaminidase
MGVGPAVGVGAARRALRLTVAAGAAAPPLTGTPHVVEFVPPRNIAIGAETPWGVAASLAELLPGTTTVRLSVDDLAGAPDMAAPVLAGAAGRPLVLVVRDAHRHPWISETLAHTLAVRPDAVIVEMGLPQLLTGGVHLATYGATRANGLAAAEVLAGRVPPAVPGSAQAFGPALTAGSTLANGSTQVFDSALAPQGPILPTGNGRLPLGHQPAATGLN